MISIVDFNEGLTRLATASRQTLGEATFEVYFEALGHETNADEWKAFTVRCVQTDRFEWFPRVPDLREALREFRGAPRLLPEAVAAYERVLSSGEYNPESGTTWSFRRVRDTCGRAAAEAFIEAGGHSAFATTWNESERREKFLEAYQLAARQDPTTRELPAAKPTEQKAIEGDVAPESGDSVAAAVQALREIRERLGVDQVLKSPPGTDTRVVLTDERREQLKRQAEAIQEQPTATLAK